jgi:cell division protein FtsX
MQIAQNVTVAANTASSKSQSAKDATSNKPETVEERITSLHAELKITPDEETNWNAVAQAMRENASAMEKLIAEKKSEAPQSMTAVEDLKSYSEFAQAHVDGLKNLTASFSTLYDAMPDQQKKLADQVFRNYGPGHRSAHNSSRKQG